MAEVDARSIYAKPFPFDVTLDGLMQFWSKVAATRGVRLRRHVVSLDFKGSVFVEFDTSATAEQVRAAAAAATAAAACVVWQGQFAWRAACQAWIADCVGLCRAWPARLRIKTRHACI